MSVHDLDPTRVIPALPADTQPARNKPTSLSVMVREFHRRYGFPEGTPVTDERTAAVMVGLIGDELDELAEALAAGDILAVADALADIAYLAYGGGVTWAIDMEAALVEVHRSNMTKGRAGPDRKPRKGPDYSPPDLRHCVSNVQ